MSHVFCKKAKLKFSSTGRTALRPFLGRWLVLVDPIWFHQSREGVLLVPQNGGIWYY